MKLWTWHEPDFSLVAGRVDLSRSMYHATVPQAPKAYAELARRLGTDQIIWCYVRRGEYHDLPQLTRVEWALDVPDHGILAITEAFIWNKILGLRTYPQSLYDKWLNDAPTDEAARDDYIAAQLAAYHSEPEPDGGWWSRLFISDAMAESATVLLRHPIPDSWILSVGRRKQRTGMPSDHGRVGTRGEFSRRTQ
jgi:hypothetical protein